MNNSGPYRSLEQFNDEEKFFNESFASVIDGDYVLNYLNDNDLPQTRSGQASGLYGQGLPDLHSFPSFTESQKQLDTLQGRNGRNDPHDSWIAGNISDNRRAQANSRNYQMESPDEFDGNAKTKKMKTNKESEVKVSPGTPSMIKSNIKNTYINKINSLITEENENPKGKQKGFSKKAGNMKNELDDQNNLILSRTGGGKTTRPCDVLQSDELEKLDIKLAKNRESARNSRIRKKVYIDLLEKTVDKLQKELAETKKQLEQFTSNANKINFQPKPVNNLYTAKHQLMERLEKMLTTRNDESEISFLLDSLRLRFGASGKERVDVVNFMFKQILEFLVPVHMKYILSAASQDKDMFGLVESCNNQINQLQMSELSSPVVNNTIYWNELAFQINLTETQKKHLLKYKKKLMIEKQKFEGIILNLNHVRKSVLKQANSLQTVVDDFRNFLTPTQLAKLLIGLEKERDRKEFSAEKLWAAVTMRKESHDEDSEVSDTFLEPEDPDDEKPNKDESVDSQ